MKLNIKPVLFSLLCSFIGNLNAQNAKTYIVHQPNQKIIIDGKLDESAWQHTLATDTFVFVDSGKKANVNTQTKVLWDSSYLYITFIVQDVSIWADKTKRDDALWERDIVEIFIDPNSDSTNYTEIGIAPNSNYYDYLLPEKPASINGIINFKWNIPGLQVAVSLTGSLSDTIHDTAWVAEIAILFNVPSPSQLHRPKNNEVWHVNFCRVDFDYGNPLNGRYYSWNSTGEVAFHRPSKFGKLIFRTDYVK